MTPNPVQVQAHEAAFRASLNAAQLAEYERIERERAAIAKPERDPEAEAGFKAASRIVPAFDAALAAFATKYRLNFVNGWLERRVGGDAAQLINLVQFFGGGRECYFGWKFMAVRCGWARTRYESARRAASNAGVLIETVPKTGGDRRIRMRVDDVALAQIDHEESALAFDQARNDPALQWMLKGFEVQTDEFEGSNPVDNYPESKGLPLRQNTAMVENSGFTIAVNHSTQCGEMQQSKGVERICKPLSPFNTSNPHEDATPINGEQREKEREEREGNPNNRSLLPNEPHRIGELTGLVVDRLASTPPTSEPEPPPGKRPRPHQAAADVLMAYARERSTDADKSEHERHAWHKPEEWWYTLANNHRMSPEAAAELVRRARDKAAMLPGFLERGAEAAVAAVRQRDTRGAAPPPVELGPDGRSVLRNDFLAQNPVGASRPSDMPPEVGDLLAGLRRKFGGKSG